MIDSSTEYGEIKRRRISDKKFRVLVRCFCTDCTAVQASEICLVNRNTAQRYFAHFRKLVIADGWNEREKYEIGNGVEVDESYFGPKRQRGKRGRGASLFFGFTDNRIGECFTFINVTGNQTIITIVVTGVKSFQEQDFIASHQN